MRRILRNALIAGAVIALFSPALRADQVLMQDSLGGSGALSGSAPDTTGTGTWTTFYFDNAGELTPNTQADANNGGFAALTASSPAGSNLPVDGVRSSSGVNVGASNSHTDDGAYIPVATAPVGLITATDTFTFPNTAASGNPTAWGFLALLTGSFGSTAATTPDVIANTAFVGPWALVRPRSNGTDVVEIYATGGTTKQVITTNVEAATITSPHVIQLQYDPFFGTLNATVDGSVLLATPYSYAAHSVALPTIDGVSFGNRSNTGLATNAAPSTTFFNGVSVAQGVPEPASASMLLLAGGLALNRRNRRAAK